MPVLTHRPVSAPVATEVRRLLNAATRAADIALGSMTDDTVAEVRDELRNAHAALHVWVGDYMEHLHAGEA